MRSTYDMHFDGDGNVLFGWEKKYDTSEKILFTGYPMALGGGRMMDDNYVEFV